MPRCSNPCESELACFRPESNRGPYGLLNFWSAALSTTELWWLMNHRKSVRTLLRHNQSKFSFRYLRFQEFTSIAVHARTHTHTHTRTHTLTLTQILSLSLSLFLCLAHTHIHMYRPTNGSPTAAWACCPPFCALHASLRVCVCKPESDREIERD